MLTTCFSPGMLPPFSVAFVKGWRRSLAALICCEAIRSLGIDFAELTDVFKVGFDQLVYFKSLPNAAWQASLRVVYATVGRHTTIKEAVWANRGQFPATFLLQDLDVCICHLRSSLCRNHACSKHQETTKCDEFLAAAGCS